jgi:hypothetical protein
MTGRSENGAGTRMSTITNNSLGGGGGEHILPYSVTPGLHRKVHTPTDFTFKVYMEYVCRRGGPEIRPLHRDLQWSIVLYIWSKFKYSGPQTISPTSILILSSHLTLDPRRYSTLTIYRPTCSPPCLSYALPIPIPWISLSNVLWNEHWMFSNEDSRTTQGKQTFWNWFTSHSVLSDWFIFWGNQQTEIRYLTCNRK